MNDAERGKAGSDEEAQGEPESGSGLNLTLIYSLIGLALIAAILIATFIVLPFYHRR
jgi:hypothetical protein